MKDHFSWHEDLEYTYPHWLYDVGTYLVYQLGENIGIGGFTAIYILTVLLSITLGLVIYMACVKISKHHITSFLIIEIEKSHDKSEKSAEKRRNNPYKIVIEKQDAVKWLILIMVICAFTGLLTPLGDTPYTYLSKTMEGNTMDNISEHQPLTLINNMEMIICIILVLGLITFTDTKIKLCDLFMLGGLLYLSFMSRRQVSMFDIIGGIIFARIVASFFDKYDVGGEEKLLKSINTIYGKAITILVVILISFNILKPKLDDKFVDENTYPVKASDYIIENVDLSTMKIYNEYNYGSYLLFRGIPVFVDSRADLYTPQFNGEKNDDGKYEGKDIFSDYINTSNIGVYYENKFGEYDITHVLIRKNSKLNMFISRNDKYIELYGDNNFVFYQRNED